MTVQEFLKSATLQLKKAGVESAQLDSLILLEDATGKDRAYLLAHPELKVQDSALDKLEAQVGRRIKREPLSYIRGEVEFYGREFTVNKNVLIPRPESESMIELLKATDLPADSWIADIGTGSGCLAVTARLECLNHEVIATDIDKKCLQVAADNARKHNVHISFVQSNLLNDLPAALRAEQLVILANLPYVPESLPSSSPELNYEPKKALYAGDDGLDLYRQLFKQLKDWPKSKTVITEALPNQHKKLVAISLESGFKLKKTNGLAQLFGR